MMLNVFDRKRAHVELKRISRPLDLFERFIVSVGVSTRMDDEACFCRGSTKTDA